MRLHSRTAPLVTVVSVVTGLGMLGASLAEAALSLVSRNASGPAYTVAVDGGTCYAGMGGRLVVAAVDDSLNLVASAHLDLPSVIDGIAVQGQTAFVATWYAGLQVVDLAAPGDPAILGSVPLPGFGRGVAVSGNIAYVAASESGLRMVDVSQPANPVEIGFYDTSSSAYDVVVTAGRAYVADRNAGIVLLDVSVPASPVLLSTLGSFTALDVDLQGDVLYVASGGLRVVDVSDPASPVQVGFLATPSSLQGVTVVSGLAYVAGFDGGLGIIDVSSPTAPVLLGWLATDGMSYEVAVDGSRAFLADDDQIVLVDVGTPTMPAVLSGLEATGAAASPEMIGDFVVVTNNTTSRYGVRFLDLSNPGAPREVSRFTTSGRTPRLAVQGNHVFLPEQWPNFGLAILDAIDPRSPELVAHLPFGDQLLHIDVTGSYAYLPRQYRFSIVNVEDPAEPYLVGTFSLGSAFDADFSGIDVEGTYAYLTDYFYGLRVVDVSVPTSPVQVGGYQNAIAVAHNVEVVGNIAHVAMSDGLHVVDMSVPSTPTLLASLPIPGEVFAVGVRNGLAYLGAGTAGLFVADVSNPSAPAVVDHFDAGDGAFNVCFYYENIVVADRRNGIFVLRNDAVTRTSGPTVSAPALRAFPNPFNPSTTISFALPKAGNVQLLVFDVRGRVVRTLVKERLDSGVHSITWDGQDDGGRRVASGVYFCRLRREQTTDAIKVVLTK